MHSQLTDFHFQDDAYRRFHSHIYRPTSLQPKRVEALGAAFASVTRSRHVDGVRFDSMQSGNGEIKKAKLRFCCSSEVYQIMRTCVAESDR